MPCSMTAGSRFIGHLFDTPQRSISLRRGRIRPRLYTLAGRELTLARRNWNGRDGAGRAWRPPGVGSASEKEEANPMVSNITVIFNFIISQWSLTPQAFKDAVLFAALTKCVLAVICGATLMLVTKL